MDLNLNGIACVVDQEDDGGSTKAHHGAHVLRCHLQATGSTGSTGDTGRAGSTGGKAIQMVLDNYGGSSKALLLMRGGCKLT